MSKRFRRPSPALVISLIALFAALGGTSYAALSISGKNVKNNSLTSSDVKNGSLLRKDFKSGQVPAGKQGPQGAAGAPGRAGTNGFGVLNYSSAGGTVPNLESDSFKTVCPAGTYPTGGDAFALTTADGFLATDTVVLEEGFSIGADNRPDGWYVAYSNNTGEDVDVFVDAICANAATPPAPLTSRASKAARNAKVGPKR